MSTRRMIFGFVVCLSIAVFVGQSLSQTRRPGRTRGTLNQPRNMTYEQMRGEQQKRIQQWQKERELRRIQREKEREQQQKERQKETARLKDESMKQAIGATQQQ